MSKTIVLEQALILPVNDITAMLQGQLIVAIPKVQIAKGLSFLLIPEQSNSQPEILERYRSPFWSLVEIVPNTNEEGRTRLEVWATCEQTKMIHDVGQIPTLSSLTVWNQSYLEELFKEQQYLFLTYLKVYRIPSSITIPSEKIPIGKTGKFVGLLSIECSSVQVTESLPILSDHLFEQRKRKLENLTPPEHPELEELQRTIALYIDKNTNAKVLSNDIQCFLGWKDSIARISQIPAWISTISSLCHRSDETPDNKLSNYHAGTAFEIIVRDSFTNLGFIVDESHQGKAGGIDAFCSKPYSLVIECKSGKSIPDNTVEELERIAKRHLKENYQSSSKLIIGPGKPTKNLTASADISQISIMKPESLQKLVELNHKHPNSINPFDLKKYLQSGEIDDKIDGYILKVQSNITIRANINYSVRVLKEQGDSEVMSAEVRADYNARFGKILEDRLSIEQVQEILIELSSPIAGYLGRVQGTDRFYFLRDLVV